MILSCCGYSINTTGDKFFLVERYKAKVKIFNDKATVEEIIYVTACQNCGHLIVKYRQKVKNRVGKKKLGKTLDLRGKEADDFFTEIITI